MSEDVHSLVTGIMGHIEKLLTAPVAPELPDEAQSYEQIFTIHNYICELRTVLDAFAIGELTGDIPLRGYCAGKLKALQANLLHLTWQIQQVAAGDFSHRVHFLGEFSSTFNSMVEQLDEALTALRIKEEKLTELTVALRNEVEQREVALEALSRSEANFRYMAEHDSLTGVLNRRSFYDAAIGTMQYCARHEEHCCIALYDLDKFKLFNDTYGHVDGDAALVHVTTIAKSALRPLDVIGRYGGEEFVCLLANANGAIGQQIADRLRSRVESNPVTTVKGKSARITLSIGVCAIEPSIPDKRDVRFLELTIRQADKALYEAKKIRNAVVLSDYSSQFGEE